MAEFKPPAALADTSPLKVAIDAFKKAADAAWDDKEARLDFFKKCYETYKLPKTRKVGNPPKDVPGETPISFKHVIKIIDAVVIKTFLENWDKTWVENPNPDNPNPTMKGVEIGFMLDFLKFDGTHFFDEKNSKMKAMITAAKAKAITDALAAPTTEACKQLLFNLFGASEGAYGWLIYHLMSTMRPCPLLIMGYDPFCGFLFFECLWSYGSNAIWGAGSKTTIPNGLKTDKKLAALTNNATSSEVILKAIDDDFQSSSPTNICGKYITILAQGMVDGITAYENYLKKALPTLPEPQKADSSAFAEHLRNRMLKDPRSAIKMMVVFGEFVLASDKYGIDFDDKEKVHAQRVYSYYQGFEITQTVEEEKK